MMINKESTTENNINAFEVKLSFLLMQENMFSMHTDNPSCFTPFTVYPKVIEFLPFDLSVPDRLLPLETYRMGLLSP